MELMKVLIPEELRDISLPSPEELTYWKSRENRTFYIDYDIDERYDLMELSKVIIQMNIEDKDKPLEELEPIKLYIFSYGGDLDQALSFCDICMSSRIPIITINMGVAMSAGLLMLLCGSKRYGLAHSRAMIHSGSAGFHGTAEQIEAAQTDYKRMLDVMKDYILDRTDIDDKTFKRNRTKDWYLTADEQLKYKVIDEVVTDISAI